MARLAQEGKVLENMRIVFLRDWRVYRKGQVIDPVAIGLGKGPVYELVARGVAMYETETTTAGYQAATLVQPQVMVKRRGRPPGSKNHPRAL